MNLISLVVIDSHDELRAVLVRRLQGLNKFEIVGDTSSPLRGVELAAVRRPKLILFDAATPGPYAAEICARIVRASPESKLVVFTSRLDAAGEQMFLEAGARMCLVKGLPMSDLAAKLELAARNGCHPTV
jgi:DNA-binding NarL/FixJ family response regulator